MASLEKHVKQAIKDNDWQAFLSCLDHGVNVETRTNKNGDTLLLLAARHGRLEMVNKLLEKKASISATNNNGETAIIAALYAEIPLPCVEALMKAGVNPYIQDHKERDAFYVLSIFVNQPSHVTKKLKQALMSGDKVNPGASPLEIVFNSVVGGRKVQETYLFDKQERFTYVYADNGKDINAVCRESFDAISASGGLVDAFEEHKKRGGTCTEEQVFSVGSFNFKFGN